PQSAGGRCEGPCCSRRAREGVMRGPAAVAERGRAFRGALLQPQSAGGPSEGPCCSRRAREGVVRGPAAAAERGNAFRGALLQPAQEGGMSSAEQGMRGCHRHGATCGIEARRGLEGCWGMTRAGQDLADEQELKDHFGFQYGKVAEVVLVKEKGSLTDMEMHLEALQEKLMEANARVAKSQGKVGMKRRQKAEENVQKMADKIAQSRQVLRHRCTCAFVTFDDEQCRVQVLEDLPPGWGLPYLISLVLTPPEKRFRGERVLMATQAAEPSDVIWENLQHNRFDLLARRALSLSAMAVMLLICAGLVVVVDNIANENELHVNCGSTEAGYENYGLGLGLPCDAMWPLDTTTSNDDPARVSIDAFREQVRLSTCNEHLYFGVYQWTDEVDAASRFNYTEYTGESEGWAGGLYPDSNADECAGEVCYACYCQDQGIEKYSNGEDDLDGFCNDYWIN
ncbi:hypothetical protein CYMTET_35089, partial [Cymbomonas tetramitiformis]